MHRCLGLPSRENFPCCISIQLISIWDTKYKCRKLRHGMVEIPNQFIHFEKGIFENCEILWKKSLNILYLFFFFSVFFFCFLDLDFSDYLRSLFSFIFVIFFRKFYISESIWRGFQFLIVFIFRFLSWQYMHILTQNIKLQDL